MEALGMIETYGLVPSIEAADAMLKAAMNLFPTQATSPTFFRIK